MEWLVCEQTSCAVPVYMFVQEAEGRHGCCAQTLEFSVLVLVGVGIEVSCVLFLLLFTQVEGTSFFEGGRRRSLRVRVRAGERSLETVVWQ